MPPSEPERLRQGAVHGPRHAPEPGRTGQDRRLLAGVQLPRPGHDLPEGEPAAEGAAQAGARQGPAARPLGRQPGAGVRYIHLSRAIKAHDLDVVFMAGPGHGAPGVLGPCYLEGSYSEIYPDCSEDEEGLLRLLQAVLLPRRDRQPLHAGDAGLDPRGRRTRLRPVARLRGRVRQPRPDRRRGRRRRRIRDRAAGHELAHQQVPQPDPRRGGPADPAPQRVQDQQPDHLGPGPARGDRGVLPRHRLDAVLRRGVRPRDDAPGDGRDHRQVRRRHPRRPEAGPRQRQGVPPALADDRAPHARRGGPARPKSAGTSSKGAGGPTRCRWPT